MGCTPARSNRLKDRDSNGNTNDVRSLKDNYSEDPNSLRKFVHRRSVLASEERSKKLENMLLNECNKKNSKKGNTPSESIPGNNNSELILDELLSSNKKIDDTDKGVIQEALLNHFLFKDLQEEILDKLVSKFILLELLPGDILFADGDEGNFFFIVKKGTLELEIPKIGKKMLVDGMSFGELCLLQKNKRSGTVKCLDNALLFCLEGHLFKDMVQKLNKYDMKERIYFLNFIAIFKYVSIIQMNNIATGMIKCEYDEGEIILNAGEIGESIYIIKEGIVAVKKNEQEIRRLYTKDYFGENSVLFETRRSFTIVALSRTICYQIVKGLLQETLGDFRNSILNSMCRESFNNSKYLKYFLSVNIFNDKIFPTFELVFYKPSQVVIPKDKVVDKICVIIEGNIGTPDNIIAHRGQLLGDTFISNSEKLSYNIITLMDCVILEAEWEKIYKVLDLNVASKKIFPFFIRLSQLRKIQVFKNLSDEILMLICYKMNKHKYKHGDKIISDGDPGNNLYLIFKGTVQVFKDDKFLREIEVGGCFGELSIILNQPHSATVIASGNVSIYTFSKEDFKNYIDKNMKDFLLKKIALQDSFSTKLEDFYYVKRLGEGKFGIVFLVHNCKYTYAIKAVNRKAVEKQKILIKYICTERNILLSLDHPFIVKLVKTFKNDDYIFFLMEYVNGIIMKKYFLSKQPTSDKSFAAQFHIGSLLTAVSYLNSKRITHRDIKPDNIMLDEKGYIKLIDFGTSIIIKDFTTTITGTPHYIAPEVLLGKGYSFSSDYWSIGIVTYEYFFNKHPFGKDRSDPMDIYKEIVKMELEFPTNYNQDKVTNFISSLLKKKANERCCNFEYLKHMPFFECFSWNELMEFKLKAPFVPDIYNTNNTLTNKKTKFLDELSKISTKESILSSYEENCEYYNPNWVNEF